MANLSELEAKINETKRNLEALQAQYAMAQKQEKGEVPIADTPTDDKGEDKAPEEAPEKTSFSEKVESRIDEVAPETADAVQEIKQAEEAQLDATADEMAAEAAESLQAGDPQFSADDLQNLFEVVHGSTFDSNSSTDAAKLSAIESAVNGDPRVARMAKDDPEKFALYMYGRKSVIS